MKPTFQENGVEIYLGDCREVLRALPDESVHCCVTSPPYWGLRDYGTASWDGGLAECDHILGMDRPRSERPRGSFHGGDDKFHTTPFRELCGKCGATRIDRQIGLEDSPVKYIATMREVFAEVRRVLRSDGTLWLNMGDSYASHPGQRVHDGERDDVVGWKQSTNVGSCSVGSRSVAGLKPKDLVGIPWMLAFALREPWTKWRIKTEAMRAWVGGIVDGEGCITILRTKSSHSDSLSFPPVVQVRMCDTEPLQRLVDVAGSSFGKPQMPPSYAAGNQRDSYQWKLVSESAAEVIAEIYPFLTCKRKQAIVAWNHQQFRTARGNQERKNGDLEKEQFCKELINKLNQRQPADIPSWMKEPTVKQEPGWYLRQDLIWAKPNPMPESVTDRCTKAHEYIFLLSKSERYYFNQEAIKEPSEMSDESAKRAEYGGYAAGGAKYKQEGKNPRFHQDRDPNHPTERKVRPDVTSGNGERYWPENRNKRSIWSVATQPFPEAHFATFPEDLIKPCILAGCPEGGTVLDPFGGSGTTAKVARELHCKAILVELNPEYIAIAARRLSQHVFDFAENRAGGVAPA